MGKAAPVLSGCRRSRRCGYGVAGLALPPDLRIHGREGVSRVLPPLERAVLLVMGVGFHIHGILMLLGWVRLDQHEG